MNKSESIHELSAFLKWAMRQDDKQLQRDLVAFLHSLYIFSKMEFGGSEYDYQQEFFQKTAAKLMLTAEKVNRHMIPVVLRIMAKPIRSDEMILHLARANAETAHLLIAAEPIKSCSPLYLCADSSAPPV